ncbi:MAG: PAS domain S-box protein [Gemmatimonadaceae bacterium]|nr:PAS domain S-box protein [Gemmatimonadaceae bacterium]
MMPWLAAPDGPAMTPDLVIRLARERDHLFLLHETTTAAERVRSLEGKLRVFLAAVLRVGFGRGTITVRDAQLEPTLVIAAGLTAEEEATLREQPASGAVWRHRFSHLEPHRIGDSYYLDSRDPWIAGEFGDALPSALPPREGADWSPRDALLVPLRGAAGDVVGTLTLDDPAHRARPTVDQIRTVELYAAQIAILVERVRLQEEREREQRLSGALSDVARAVNESLEPGEVRHLIVRHAIALLKCDGAVLSLLADGMMECVATAGSCTALDGLRVPPALLATQAMETGMAALSNDYSQEAFRDPVVIDHLQPRRVLVVPLISRTGPIGVLAAVDRDRPFTDSDAELLQRMADQVAMAVVNATLFDQVATLAERYRLVVETTRDAIVITDRTRRIVFSNAAADELFGVAQGSRPAMASLVPPELRADVAAHEDSALAGQPQRYESVVLRPDGERRTIAVATAPLYEQGEITGIVATLRDVTEERRARDAVAESEARYRNLFETATDAIYTLDLAGTFTSLNEATCDFTGAPLDELLGRPLKAYIDPVDLPRVKEHFRGALNGEARSYEAHYVRIDGARRLASVTNTPIRRDGAIVGVLGIARDVTAEREREHALARSQARYTRLVESASDAIFTTDDEGRLTSVNRAFERASGLTRTALLGTAFTAILHPADREPIAALLADAAGGRRSRAELRYQAGDGSTRHGSLLATPIYEGGRLAGLLGIVRDVTDEKHLSEQLLQQEKLAAVGQLVSGVAHELNNPLAGVVAFSQLLLAADAPPDQRRAAETIHAEAKRAARIVANLLTFARQHQPERTVTDVNRIVDATIDLRRYTLRTNQVDVELALDESLPLTWADPHQLQQVIVNLVANAEQALAEWAGRRRITVATTYANGMLQIQVRDSGPGIPAEHLGRVFNPFFTTKGVGKGTGLGLSISHGIIREHGGRIRAESAGGEGATFTIELPHVPPPEQEEAPEQPAGASSNAPARRILVVDDEPAIRSVLTTFLTSLGHEVEAFGSGRDALARAAVADFDRVLLDLRMPDMSGDAVFAELQAMDPALASRVVFVTGDLQSQATRRFLDSTGRPVLTKPFLLDDLAALVGAPAEAR